MMCYLLEEGIHLLTGRQLNILQVHIVQFHAPRVDGDI